MILIGVITHKSKSYCDKEFINSLKELRGPNTDIVVIDNSEDDYSDVYIKEGFKVFNLRKKSRLADTLASCSEFIRHYAIDNDYEYLFMLESDVIIEKEDLDLMLCLQAPVCAMTYLIGVGENSNICLQASTIKNKHLYSKIITEDMGFELFKGKVTHSKDILLGPDTFLSHSGLGCTLIHSSVLKRVNFRSDSKHDSRTKKQSFCDTFFYFDLLKKNIDFYFYPKLATHLNMQHI